MAKRTVRQIRIQGNIAYIPLTRGYEAIIDADDAHLAEGFIWFASVKLKSDGTISSVYACRETSRRNGALRKSVFLHRVIAETPDGFQTDHIDGNGLNNRRANLRLATPAQNQHNQRTSIRNTSGVKGVCWDKRIEKWKAQITINGMRKWLGNYDSIDAAANSYAEASANLHPRFGRLS
jgi:hypothetical protein